MEGEILLIFDEMNIKMGDREARTVNGPEEEAFFGKVKEESNNATNIVHYFVDHTFIIKLLLHVSAFSSICRGITQLLQEGPHDFYILLIEIKEI
jgi:hypothetical protein